MRSRRGSDARVLSIHFAWAGVRGARGVNGPGCGDGGVGSGVGFGRGGMVATALGVVADGAGWRAGLPAHETRPAVGERRAIAAIARVRFDELDMYKS
jgi:hypothetical protein